VKERDERGLKMTKQLVEKNRAYIICNGQSRIDFDLSRLSNCVTFGCNALYREWVPTWLISIDKGISPEIRTSSFPNDKHIVPPLDEQHEPVEYNPNRPRSNAGMNAMAEAIKKGYNQLYILGMDFILADNKYTMSNLFDGTENYGMETRATERDQLARCGYLTWFCRKHNDTSFRFVFPRDVEAYREIKSPNVTGMFYDQLTVDTSVLRN